ncbi:type III-B CRISPR module RAMP protein Cmr4 [Thermus sp.]|uniref:type III-B CRISPR module RAMP protein Cmr4 n=1 Tax=Thermus sp. TaxID=275 RepID=UPI003D14A385
MGKSYGKWIVTALALDPVHVGAGGGRIGRVDLTIVRDPATRVPKIPGSSLAGVYRTYVAMAEQEANPDRQVDGKPKPYYPDCAGLGLDQERGHCRRPDCPVCTVFGFARGAGQEGGFAGLAAFTDAHVLLFPVPTRRGPRWVTSPMALRALGLDVEGPSEQAVYLEEGGDFLNLGWLLLPIKVVSGDQKKAFEELKKPERGLPGYIRDRLALVDDRLFQHIVNSNLEVRTSVSIDPATGAAQEKALFSYEALPKGTVLVWEVIAKNPMFFTIGGKKIELRGGTSQGAQGPGQVWEVVQKAHPYLEHLGIGGMGTRGMGRVRVLHAASTQSPQAVGPAQSSGQGENQP